MSTVQSQREFVAALVHVVTARRPAGESCRRRCARVVSSVAHKAPLIVCLFLSAREWLQVLR